MIGIIRSQKNIGVFFWCVALAMMLSLQTVAGWLVEERSTLHCHRRPYRTHVEQFDEDGRKCWDTIKIKSCWGRCDSNEISDWQFPYKRSHHPVCMHQGRRWAVARLANCEPGAAPDTDRYHYMEATTCKCQICSSEDTSCEWLPADTHELVDLFPQSNKVISQGELEDDD